MCTKMFKMGWGLKVATRWGIGPLCPLSICHWALYNILYMSLFNHYRYYYHFFIINHYVVLFLILYIKRQIWECMLCWGVGGKRGRGFDYLSIDILDLIGRYCPVFTGNYRYFPVFPARPGNKAGVREICQPCLPLSRSLQFPKYSCSDFFSFFFLHKVCTCCMGIYACFL